MITAPSGADWAAYQGWRPRFRDVLDPVLYTIEWLDERVWSGSAMFDRCPEAAILSEWKFYPTGALRLEGLLAAGKMTSIRDILIPLAEQRARDAGAIGALIASRPAWAKILRSRGYEDHQTTIEKRFTS